MVKKTKIIKNNVEKLIELNKYDEALYIINEYKELNSKDIDIYSIQSVILMLCGEYEQAEDAIKEGLKIEEQNYNLLFNLAYLYDLKGDNLNSLIQYRKAKKYNYYEIEHEEIDMNMELVTQKLSGDLKNISKINNVLFISKESLKNEMNNLAEVLNKYGINVDLACAKRNPSSIKLIDNPYRKILQVGLVDNFIEYILNNNYDCIYILKDDIFNENKFKEKDIILLHENLAEYSENEILKYFSDNVRENKVELDKCNKECDLTILIPTYNRPYYLKRLLTYINNFTSINPKIIVLDSSQDEKAEENRLTINNMENKNIKYISFSSDINYFKKVNIGLNEVNTDYVTICADDDFLIEDGLKVSIEKLQSNDELYTVKGKNMYFTKSMANLYEYDWFNGLEQDDSISRLREITKGFVPGLIYQVFKTDGFKKMYIFVEENFGDFPKNDTFCEYLFYFIVIATGKIAKINVDLNIRDKSVPRETVILNFPHALVSGEFNQEYEKFSDMLIKYLNEVCGYKKELKKIILDIFVEYLVNFIKVPRKNIVIKDGKFNVDLLEEGMRQTWVWPINL